MQSTIVWTGIEYYSLEHCLITKQESGNSISSVIVGMYQDEPYRVGYSIRTDASWHTKEVKIESLHANRHLKQTLVSDGAGNWLVDGLPEDSYSGCLDVDLPLTPFTNSLPVNRLRMQIGESNTIKVIYLDLLANKFSVVHQQYKRLDETVYHYENIPNDFEADILVDSDGFVENYPMLFKRSKKLQSAFDPANEFK